MRIRLAGVRAVLWCGRPGSCASAGALLAAC